MKHFKKLVREINTTLTELTLFDIIINTIIIFLFVYLILSLFNLYPIFSILPAVIFIIFSSIKRLRRSKVKKVESKHDKLKEKLRTAVDNINEDNPVVQELQEEVIEEVKKVGISSFIRPRRISFKIFSCVLLAFIIVFVSTFNLEFLDMDNLIQQLPSYIESNPLMIGGERTTLLDDVNLSDDLYGEKDIATLGNEQLNIKIRPSNFQVNVKEGGDAEKKQFDEIFPQEVFIESSETFDEEIPLEEQELVKTYFNKLTS